MIIHAKAPLRIGLAGGGTDVSPYCDIYGGYILNACITMYAYATIEPMDNCRIEFFCADRNQNGVFDSKESLEIDDNFKLMTGVYNRIVKDYTHKPLSFKLTTYVDAPAGSGLGSSSTLVVAIVKAFQEWLNLPLSEYDIAKLAWSIEREDLQMAGGKQDQYASTFGGFNFMEFRGEKVLVNPLRIKQEYLNELEFNILLFYTGTSRLSAKIIENQSENAKKKKSKTLNAMDKIKQFSYDMKEALLTGNLRKMGDLLNDGWTYKKQMSDSISNPMIDNIYETALRAGATGGKISGAGGGGFFMFYCPDNTRYKVIEELKKLGGEFRRYRFTSKGAESWTACQ